MLKSRVDRLAVEPEDTETLVEAVTLYHMVIEGMLALTGQHFIISYNEEVGTLPGFVEGFNNVARDEHRHVAFGARFLREMAQKDERYRDAIQRTLVECGPAADGVLQPPWADEETRAVRRRPRGDARVRDEGARAADEGDRARARRLSRVSRSARESLRSGPRSPATGAGVGLDGLPLDSPGGGESAPAPEPFELPEPRHAAAGARSGWPGSSQFSPGAVVGRLAPRRARPSSSSSCTDDRVGLWPVTGVGSAGVVGLAVRAADRLGERPLRA